MIPLPNLPTDSLYKFMFVLGIFLIGLAEYSTLKEFDYAGKFIVNDDQMLNKADFSLDSITGAVNTIKYDSLKEYNKFMKTADSALKGRKLKKSIALKLIAREKYIVKQLSKTNKDIYKIDSLKNNIKSLQKKAELWNTIIHVNHNQWNVIKSSVVALWYLGSLLTLLGGILWYWKIQRHQDTLIFNEVHKSHENNERRTE